VLFLDLSDDSLACARFALDLGVWLAVLEHGDDARDDFGVKALHGGKSRQRRRERTQKRTGGWLTARRIAEAKKTGVESLWRGEKGGNVMFGWSAPKCSYADDHFTLGLWDNKLL
jgi:hypothetical protein